MANHTLTEEDLKNVCPYCKTDLSGVKNWTSCFCGSIHYKHTTCKCGHDVDIKVHFEGSGHDNWSGAPSWMFNDDKIEKSGKDIDALIEENKDALEDRRSKSKDGSEKRRKDD